MTAQLEYNASVECQLTGNGINLAQMTVSPSDVTALLGRQHQLWHKN